jgi:signal transduction histidine kinase
MKEFSHPGTKDMQWIDINRAVENTLTVSRNEWKHVAEVVTQFDSDLPAIPCLPADLNQALLNILVNAAHAIQEKDAGFGRITVSTCRDGDWIEIRIGDTGNGIPKSVQPRIFDHFFTTKEVGKGTGQGLTIAHAVIVEKHGGTLRFESEVGQGTTFMIRLPLQEKAANSPSAVPT